MVPEGERELPGHQPRRLSGLLFTQPISGVGLCGQWDQDSDPRPLARSTGLCHWTCLPRARAGGHLAIPISILLLVLEIKGGGWREERLRTLGGHTGKSWEGGVGRVSYLTCRVHPSSTPALCQLLHPQAGSFQPETSSPVCLPHPLYLLRNPSPATPLMTSP